MTTVADLIEELEDIAPPELADNDDRIGLQVGDGSREVRRMCVSLDASPQVVEAAIARKADMLVSHHPLIYSPLKSLAGADPVVQRVVKLIRADVALYVMHTNYDTAPGGVNDVLAEKLGVTTHGTPLVGRKQDSFYKIVVFVPEAAIEDVRNAMADAGAGMIGQYTHCSFRVQGTGSFVPLSAARPYIGSVGKMEEVDEYRLEMVCVGSWLENVIAAMLERHPYDGVAHDIYELANEPITYGLGRVGSLEAEMKLLEFADRVKSALELDYVKVAGDPDKRVMKVALCSGSGSGFFRDAALAGADVYVTGDTKHHDIIDANALGLAIIDAGHFGTEKPAMVALAERLKKASVGRKLEIEYIE